jgi:histone H3/H4
MAADPEEEKTQPPPAAVEFEPPLACVRRILKHTLPSSTNVGKDASAAFARASGIFIIYLTACANDFARTHKRQTITANDVLAAIKVSYCLVKESRFARWNPHHITDISRLFMSSRARILLFCSLS